MVLAPLVMLFIHSFQVGVPGSPLSFGLDGWRQAFSDPRILRSVDNTIRLTLARQVIAIPLAILLAWLLARTDLPGRNAFEFCFWLSFFLPALSVTLGWILLLDRDYGLVNQWLTSLPLVRRGLFNIHSFWGIVWIHLMTYNVSAAVILLVPAFRHMDASLEEASRLCGASRGRTLIRIVIPTVAPAILVVLMMAIIRSLEAFEIEWVLGAPFGLHVYATKIYELARATEPPAFGPATALASVILLVLLPLIGLERWYVGSHHFTTVTGRFTSTPTSLGKWKLPAFCGMVLIVGLLTVVPAVSLVAGSFMEKFGFVSIPNPWTLGHWADVFKDTFFWQSVRNTVLIAGGSALIAIPFFSLVAYAIVRGPSQVTGLLDFFVWLPWSVPGVLMGMGFLWFTLGTPLLRPLYGTMGILVVSSLFMMMPVGTQIVKANLLQLGSELEEASRIAGGTWGQTFRRVLVPLLSPVLLVVAIVTFVSAARDISNMVLLATPVTRPLSLLMLDFLAESRYEGAAVVSCVVVSMTTGLALIARAVGLRTGIRL
jgi:iron(III) transport system permease protein